MECKNCHSRWEPSQTASRTLTACPFCGASLSEADSGKMAVYDNSKDALAHIMRVHGADVLLGSTLKNFLMDYAPRLEVKRKNVILIASSTGATEILKRNLSAGVNEREIAFKQAVQKVVDTYGIERSLTESVILEFTDVLGWKISVQQQTQPEQRSSPPERLVVGQRNVKFGKYEWRVLDIQGGKALLLAEHIVEKRRYHSSRTDITWKDCELRGYLNREFLRTFSSEEQGRIVQVVNKNEDNQWYGTSGGADTTDKIFLLSLEEVVKYFGDSGQLRNRPKYKYWITDQYNSAREALGVWGLRSPGRDGDRCVMICSGGYIYMGGSFTNVDVGIFPALWLKL